MIAVDVPILGINLGRIGFLSKAETDELESVLEMLQAGDYELRPRMGLAGAILSNMLVFIYFAMFYGSG